MGGLFLSRSLCFGDLSMVYAQAFGFSRPTPLLRYNSALPRISHQLPDERAPQRQLVSRLAPNHPLYSKYPSARRSRIPNLPLRHYVNLTNGVEVLPILRRLGIPRNELRFTRIQSSLCEAQAWSLLLDQLDTDLIFSLACGHTCYVYDLGCRNRLDSVPRAIWMGVEFVKYALTYFWADEEKKSLPDRVFLRGKNVASYWKHICRNSIDKPVRKRVKYYKEYTEELGLWSDGKPQLFGVFGHRTEFDGCKDVHVKMVRDALEQPWEPDLKAISDHRKQEEMLARAGLYVFTPRESFIDDKQCKWT